MSARNVALTFEPFLRHISIVQRQQWLNTQASSLKYIAERFDIPVVGKFSLTFFQHFSNLSNNPHQTLQTYPVTNQVTPGNNSQLLPALGNTWAHCVNTRLRLNATKEVRRITSPGHSNASEIEVIKRTLKITKSPLSGPVELQYEINERGVVDY